MILDKYHTPVMEKETRFYMIKFKKILNIADCFKTVPFLQKNQKNQNKKSQQSKKKTLSTKIQQSPLLRLNLTLQTGCRSSTSSINIQFQIQPQEKEQNNEKQKQDKVENQKDKKSQEKKMPSIIERKQKIKQDLDKELDKYEFTDLHIFPFEKEEVLTVKLQNVQNPKEYGFALIPLIPFVKLSHSKHQIEVDLVFENEQKQITNKSAATVFIQLYFMNNFKGRILFEPHEAELNRNMAEFGQMNPKIKLFLRERQFDTEVIDEGGIKPHWQSQQLGKTIYFNFPMQSVLDKLFLYLISYNQLGMDSMIGSYEIDIQKEGIFKTGINYEKFLEKAQKFCMQKPSRQIEFNWLQQNNDKKEKKLMENEQQPKQKRGQKSPTKQRQNQKGVNLGKNSTSNAGSKNINEQIEDRIKQRLQTIKKKLMRYIKQLVSKQRKGLIRHIMENEIKLTTRQLPQRVWQLIDQIYLQFQSKQNEIAATALENIKKNQKPFSPQTQPDKLAYLQKSSKLQLPKQTVQEQIKKLLQEELRYLAKFIRSQMQTLEIPLFLKEINVIDKLQRKIQIGTMMVKCWFLFEFDCDFNDEQVIDIDKIQP